MQQPRRTATAATPAQVAANALARAEGLREYIATLNAELDRLKSEMRTLPKTSPARLRYRQRAKQVLRQKKDMERRLEHALNMTHNMTIVQDTQEEQRQAALFQAIRTEFGSGQTVQNPNAHSINDLDQWIQESNQIAAILGSPLDDATVDDDELEEDLDREMEAEFGRVNTLPASFQTVPSQGTHNAEGDAVARVQALQAWHEQPGAVPAPNPLDQGYSGNRPGQPAAPSVNNSRNPRLPRR